MSNLPDAAEHSPPPLPPPSPITQFNGPTSSYGVDPYAPGFGSSGLMQPTFGNPYSMGYNSYGNFGGLYGTGMGM